jgi:Cu(I)/Ag(I) efflux system membrane fusion protein
MFVRKDHFYSFNTKDHFMNRFVAYAMIASALALVIGLTGCPRGGANNGGAPADMSTDHAGEHGSHNASDVEKMKAELAKLPPEDAASAEKQHFCPVSGEMLGTMGPPLKVDVNGTQVWICCKGCREELLANPDEFLAKLNKE